MRRVKIATVLGVGLLALGGVAHAHEMKPVWGYAFVDESPFYEPNGGPPLPSTQVYPRGRIRDVPPADGMDVRMTVQVYTPGMSRPAYQYATNEGDFVDVTFDRRLDIAPLQVSYLRYDFCRFNPSNGVVEECLDPYYLGRPTATPVPTPTPGPGTQPAPVPTDADGDGVVPPLDCSDQNVTVHPGAKEIPGNGLDDDCAGGDAPGRILAGVKNKWVESGRRMRVDRLRVVDAPVGARVEVRCSGRRCAFKRRATATNDKGEASLRRFFKRGVRPRVTIDVRVTYPNMIGRVFRFRVKRLDVPDSVRLCLPPGVDRPQRC